MLPAAIDLGIAVSVGVRSDSRLELCALDLEERYSGTLSDIGPDTQPAFARYVGGVVAELNKLTNNEVGINAIVSGNLPVGGGLSSSAALEMATALAVSNALSIDLTPWDMALLGQTVEWNYAGVSCGIMDQAASRLGSRGSALWIDCGSGEYSEVKLPEELALLVVDSGVPRALSGSAYDERVAQCESALQQLREEHPGLESLTDASSADVHASALSGVVRKRCRHVVAENERVDAAIAAIQDKDLHRFGRLLYQSHDSLRDDFEVSCAELDSIVTVASRLPDVFGARLTGAGFGGNAIVAVRETAADAVIEQLQSELFPNPPEKIHRSRRGTGETAGVY